MASVTSSTGVVGEDAGAGQEGGLRRQQGAQEVQGLSRLPLRVVEVRAPVGVVAECWPPVMP